MEGERKRSKGGFFHLFDWNGKSRKKLFANNAALPEGSKQDKENVGNAAKLLLQVVEVDERRADLSKRVSSDISCASSVTSDEGYGSKLPSVVARLMGLDSLPSSSVAETGSSPFTVSHCFKVSQHNRSTPSLWSENDPIGHLNLPNNREKHPCNGLEPRRHKEHNRPIERFQTEILPPKSAKSIPVTHHKLLSPIKNPGFIQKKNVAYIVEAAAKIIEASPKGASNNKVPSIGSSSVPLRIRDLKQKMESVHSASRPQRSEPSPSKSSREQLSEKSLSRFEGTRRQLIEKSQSGSGEISSSRTSTLSGKGTSNSWKTKGKSVPLAAQATSNVQRKEGSFLRSNNLTSQKDQIKVKADKSPTNHSVAKKTAQQRSFGRTSNVLRPNNQKQNSLPHENDSTLKNSVSIQQGRKGQSTKSSVGPSRISNKVIVKPETMSKKDTEQEKTKGISRKKRYVNGDLRSDGGVSSDVPSDKNEGSRKGIVTMEGSMNATAENKKNGMDIVSFTFMSPIKKPICNPSPSGQMVEKVDAYAIDHSSNNHHPDMKSAMPYFPGLAVIGGDALGVLLEQKLRELTNKMESSHCNVITEETFSCSTSRLQNTVSTLNTTSIVEPGGVAQIVSDKSKSGAHDSIDYNSEEYTRLDRNHKWQRSEEMEVHSSSSFDSESGKGMECQHPSPVSTLEPSSTSESFSNTNESKLFDGISMNESLEIGNETELSDSASSSICTVDVVRKNITITSTKTESRESTDWELHYTRDMLNNAELLLQEFALGQTDNVISPHLFNQLEYQENAIENDEEDYSKLGRKVLFDCISERLDFMSGQVFVGSCKAWDKLGSLFQRKGWLAEELCKEILGWKNMGDLMVDELVDRDMSTQYGKWLDFSIEAFEEGIEIENGILTCLVDELVSDLLM
ncbi:hypothetical protein Tsubulata_037385 [Turnera subulata]|uniref:DUF4378 domain-containing protein n=1 Tax=Turnera subulata TaxID=218843 RepID=A0A9Q0J0B2_9ROSI|nr:hypothetical protein Tsubulata_037385 [Turnera subulata]